MIPVRSNADAGFLEFAWVWNRRQRMETPPVHRRIARWLEARQAAGESRLLLMAFRGCGKSTLVGLWCAWQLAQRPETRILVLAADAPLAVKMVATVRRIVERHPLCRHLIPEGAESWASDRFTVARGGALRDPSMLAQGIGGNVTGSRAEIIVCDDVEVAGNCDTPGKRAELRERLAEAEFVLTPGGTILFVGTPHCEDSLYRDPKEDGAFLRGYRRLAVPVMNAAGASAWPERFPREAIAALRDRVGPLQFQRQMMLQPVAASAVRLDPAAIIRYGDEPDYREAQGRGVLTLLGHRLVSGGAFWDPAYGRPGAGDASVLACCFSDGEGRFFLHRLAYLTHDPASSIDPATQQCRKVAAMLGELLLPSVRVETNGLGKFLPALLRRELGPAGVACQVIEHASSRAKEDRILAALEPALAARRLYAHESVFGTPFAGEMAEWRPGAPGARDDALDAVAGCLLAEPVRLVRGARPVPRPSWRGA
jgi:hypothetical protein